MWAAAIQIHSPADDTVEASMQSAPVDTSQPLGHPTATRLRVGSSHDLTIVDADETSQKVMSDLSGYWYDNVFTGVTRHPGA